MTTPSPESLGNDDLSHLSALAWLGLLYRRPVVFRERMEALPLGTRVRAGLLLQLHALPWLALLVLLANVGRRGLTSMSWADWQGVLDALPWAALGVPTPWSLTDVVAAFVASWQGLGALLPWILGVFLLGAVLMTLRAVIFGLTVGVLGTAVFASLAGLSTFTSSLDTATAAVSLGVGIGLASRLSGAPPWRGDWLALGAVAGMAFGLSGGLRVGLLAAVAVAVVTARAYLWPIHSLIMAAGTPGRFYRWHPIAWDDVCSLPASAHTIDLILPYGFKPPFARLPQLLVELVEGSPQAGVVELARLYAVPQRAFVAARAVSVLCLRSAASEPDLKLLPQRLRALAPEACGDLGRALRVRELVGRIARQQAVLDGAVSNLERVRQARRLHRYVEDLQHYAATLPLAQEFAKAAGRWADIAQRQVDAAMATAQRDHIPRVFRAGNPIDRAREAFVPRAAVFAALEREVALASGSPGVLLYGRRRTGKSTVLRNLAGFLPAGVRVAELSMQDPRAFTSLREFVALLAERVAAACPAERRPVLPSADLTGLRTLLEQADAALEPDRKVVVGIDEYELLDAKIGEGALPHDLLACVRTAIQAHPRVVWLFAGSLAIEELPHAAWTSALVGARTIEVPPFSQPETFALLTDPLAHSPLWARDDPARPRFDTAFWGEGTVERIQAETGGWPHLVQLLAEVTVDLLSERDDRSVSPALFERALERTVEVGDAVLRLLVQSESRLPGEWEYLARFHDRASQAPPDDDVRRSLRRRLLVVEEAGLWRLRVPLMQRWLRRHG